MVQRMIRSAEQGILLSRPGVNVSRTDVHRLMDPRFPMLEVHATGEGELNLYDEGDQRDIWERTWTFPDLGYVPIFMASATFTNQPDRINYPASLPPRFSRPSPIGTISYWNQIEIKSNSIRLRIANGPNEPRPDARWTVFKNPRVM